MADDDFYLPEDLERLRKMAAFHQGNPEPLRCPCGEVHELSDQTRVAYENIAHGLPAAVPIIVSGRGWHVPRIFVAVHGLKGDDLPTLAERYGFERV